jgi:hypothetical protein
VFWYKWNSWITEILGGAALGLVVNMLIDRPLLALLGATLASFGYEFLLDESRNRVWHHPWQDVGQRAVGIVVGVVLLGGWLLR